MQLTNRFGKAFNLALAIHSDQKRKGTPIPYISHLMSVSALVMEHGGSEDQIIAALLHDAIEDGEYPEEVALAIESQFGNNVLQLVKECSDTEVNDPKPPWKERKETYLKHLKEEVSSEAMLISMCDKLHNLRCTVKDWQMYGDSTFEKFRGGKEGTIWYYTTLRDIYKEKMHQLEGDQELYKNTIEEIDNLLDWFKL